MGKVIAITNQKGGVGKTTTSVNLAAALSIKGKKVLLIDLDPQGNASTGLGIDRDKVDHCMQSVLVDDVKLKDILLKGNSDNIYVAPATINLAGADILLMEKEQKEQILKEKIKPVKKQFDYIIIDCPPSLGLLNQSALTAADSVLIPVQAQHYALEGIKQLFSVIQIVQRLHNKKLNIEGILITMFDVRTNLSQEVKDVVDQTFKERAYKTTIPQNTKLAEAPIYGKSIFEYDASSKGAKAYLSLAEEVIANGDEK